MLDVSLLKSHYLRGPLTKEQENELITALRDNGITNVYDLTSTKRDYAFFIIKAIFSEHECLTYKIMDQPGGWGIHSHLKEISFEDLYVPEENMDFSKELFELLGV